MRTLSKGQYDEMAAPSCTRKITMPTYVYKREDGSTFEFEQRITEDPLDVCPTTGQSVVRVISGGTGLIFKGSGFYLTDYVRNGSQSGTSDKNNSTNGASAESKTSKEAGSSDTSATTKKPDAKKS